VLFSYFFVLYFLPLNPRKDAEEGYFTI